MAIGDRRTEDSAQTKELDRCKDKKIRENIGQQDVQKEQIKTRVLGGQNRDRRLELLCGTVCSPSAPTRAGCCSYRDAQKRHEMTECLMKKISSAAQIDDARVLAS